MFHEYLKLEIKRERNRVNSFIYQPLLVISVLMLIIMMRVLGLLFLSYVFFLVFPILFVSYIYINFIKSPNNIFIEIKRNCLIISEPNNPFSKHRNIFIDGIRKIEINPMSQFLEIDVQNQSYQLLNMNSFWFGYIAIDSLQELLFYLATENPTLLIDEQLNEV